MPRLSTVPGDELRARAAPPQVATPPVLVRLDSSTPRPPIPLNQPLTIIGSKPEAHVQLRSHHVSGAHCALVDLGNVVLLRDLGSRTGVFLNEKQMERAELAPGDIIRVGRYRFRFDDPRAASSLPIEGKKAVASLRTVDELVRIEAAVFTIGRHESADFRIDHDAVSKAHALIVRTSTQWFVCDLCSRGGTRLNGRRVTTAAVRPGDRLEIGEREFVFDIEKEPETSEGGMAAGQCLEASELPGLESSEVERLLTHELTPATLVPATDAEVPSTVGVASQASMPAAELGPAPAGSDTPTLLPGNPRTICQKWGPLAVAVADPTVLDRISASRRGAATSQILTEPNSQSAPAPRSARGRAAIVIATGAVTLLGAAWFFISHPHLLALP